MRDDELRRLLGERNPWWKLSTLGRDPTSWAAADPTLAAAAASGIVYDPPILHDVAPPGLYVLRGPRRVGKSVAAKRLLLRFCRDERYTPIQLIFLSVDGFSLQDLRRALVLGRDMTSTVGDKPRIWVIDEITAVPGWIPLIKELRDNTQLAHDALVLTGSSATDLADARRALGTGRTHVSDPFRLLLPMTFRAFLDVTGVQLPATPLLPPSELQSRTADTAVRELSFFIGDLDLAWQRFLTCGGFPRAVAEFHQRRSISPEFVFDLLSWLISDVSLGVEESTVVMLDLLQSRMGSPLNLKNTAEHLRMSRTQWEERLRRLLAAMAAIRCAQVDDTGRPVVGSQAKYYLIDPLLAHLPHLREPTWAEPDMTRLTEAQLAAEIARCVDRLQPDRLIEQRAVAYTRTTSGNEIDFAPLPVAVKGQRTTTVPIEVKWVSKNWRRSALTLANRYGRGILATKDVADTTGTAWAIPAPILALLLN
ncbi:MAG: ATP-binding protein [Acidothermus sp.]|nr:ATP-binding protein [Acidothermus sp.]